MERRGNKVDIVQRVSCWISDMAFARFKSFSDRVLGIQIDEIPTVESILMRQNFSVVFYAAILFILTNGIYLVKNIAARSMIPIDMVPLYMMIGGSLAMLVFTIAYKKRGGEYDAPPGAVCAAGLLWGGDRQRYRLYGLLQLSPGRVVHLHVLSVCDHDRRPHTAVWIPWRYVF